MNLWRLAWLWFVIGLQSFGGGTATLFLIRRMAVDQYQWLTPAAFTRDWSLVQAAPGINLLCMVILVGRRVAGFGGALAALGGLMLPSIAITIVMTALYASFRDLLVVQATCPAFMPIYWRAAGRRIVNLPRRLPSDRSARDRRAYG